MNATSRHVSRAPSRAALGVAAAGLVAFLPSLFCGFVYDDVLLISENPYAQSTAYLARAFRTHLWDVYSFGEEGIGLRYYRPLVSISYIANWLLGGGGAWAFHLFNALLHAAATFLAVRVAARWTGSVALGVVAGLLFALHPTRTESVIWIAGRTDLMMAVFSLGAIELAHAGAKAEPRRAWLLNVLAALSTMGATLSKEAGALTGLLIFVDAALLRAGSRERRRLIALAAGLALLGACYIAGRGLFYPVRPKQEVLFESTPAYGLMTVWSYVERTVFPWPQTFFYRPIQARGGQPSIPASLTVLGALAVVGYGVLVAWALRRDRVAGLLLIAAVVLLGPLLNFSYTGIFVTTSDHFLYLPLLLLTAGVLRLAAAPLGSWMEIRAVQLAVGGILFTYLGVDALRALDYRGDETLFSHEISVEPNNPFALNSVAILRARDGELAEAEALLERAQSPEATRFFLLATPAARAGTYIRQLALRAALTPDGDLRSLDLIFSELDALSRGRSGSRTGNAGSLKVGLRIDADVLSKILTKGGRFGLFADAAVVGARIGQDDRVAELLSAVPDARIWRASNPLNVALTHARIGDFAGARRRLRVMSNPPPGVPGVPHELVSDFEQRLGRAERLAKVAEATNGPTAALNRALEMAELGAYLRALRIVRPLYAARPEAPEIASLYVQLLVAARLDAEARRVAGRVLGAAAESTVDELEHQLSPRVRALPPAPDPSPWSLPDAATTQGSSKSGLPAVSSK